MTEYLCDKHREELKTRLGFQSKNDPQIKFNNTLHIINLYVMDYQDRNPGATKREACMAYAKEKGLTLPKFITEAEHEAQAEREAIQAEGNDYLQDLSENRYGK